MLSHITRVPYMLLAGACALLGACCALHSTEKPAHPPPDPIARFAGRWARFGPYNIIGAGSDHIWTIAREDGCWSLAITVVRHPSVNEKSRALTRTSYAPTPLTWRDGRLDFVYPPSPLFRTRLTADIVGDRLMLPALVQRDQRKWEFEAWNERELFQCEHDPRLVPSGSAVVSLIGYPGKPCYYRTSTARSWMTQDRMVLCIVFFQLAPDGAEHICAQLVFEGEPYGTVMRLGESYSGFAGDAWERLSDEDWRTIQALPLVQPP